ncbi:MAG: hypothetical protein WB623_25820 [Candidatus Sulfotelmatobacter sp.]
MPDEKAAFCTLDCPAANRYRDYAYEWFPHLASDRRHSAFVWPLLIAPEVTVFVIGNARAQAFVEFLNRMQLALDAPQLAGPQGVAACRARFGSRFQYGMADGASAPG